ncbi:exopolysaccharide biosynthesis operon protein EpsL [Actimicrobium sp. GrIS 1.19]|uniref:XrtB/PEP-CTERM-associated polysaccharide biosynthesis outer membrane protein EpsL n=1 Tax=Actimicrobium sp. GrIS 1.19 TaxID=3071708 RepID=UPI002DFEB858|nr:exopolysaccharide biosynthesis operon protein EpsL [Actimicrobium sp. GrIS 1.19]
MTPDFFAIPAIPARRWSWSRAANRLLHLGALTSLPAMAAADDVFRPYIGYALSQDDNVLGVGDGSSTTGGSNSALSRHAEAGLFVNERLSQQIITAALKFSHITYDELPELNNDGKDLLVNWNWHLGNHLDGNIGSSYVQALTPFVNFHSRERNLRADRRQFVDGGWLFHPSWRVRAGASRDSLTYDLASQQGGNRVENVLEVGLDYLAPSGSTFGTQLRHTRGEFPNPQQIGAELVDNSYNQDEIKAKISWLMTAKTQLQFLGGLVQRRHETFPSRDYSGFNARLTTIWQASAKTGVTAAAWREIGALDDVTASYTLNQGLSPPRYTQVV